MKCLVLCLELLQECLIVTNAENALMLFIDIKKSQYDAFHCT